MATLHNRDQVAAKDVRPGYTVVVRKAADVIPEVVGPVLAKRPTNSQPWEFPTTCPCPVKSTLVKLDDQADTRCVETDCPHQREQKIIYFAARGGMDIEGLGDNTVMSLADAGLVRNVADLFALTFDDLMSLGSFSAMSASKLIFELDKARSQTLARVLSSLGIKHVGPIVATQLAEQFGHLDQILGATEEDLHSIDGVGEAVYASIQQWQSVVANREMVEALRDAGVAFDNVPNVSVGTTLDGQLILVTGKLTNYQRDEVKEVIRAHGGKAASGVSSNTTIVVAGDKAAAPKIKKAQELGIPVIDGDQFETLLRTGQLPEGVGK
jgi:DNA ligase (NAD+)